MVWAKSVRAGIVALAALVATGCASGPALIGSQRVTVVESTVLPPPVDPDFTLGAFDRLKIDVFGISELSIDSIQVDANGNISLPIAGTLHAGGKTPALLAEDIAAALRTGHVRYPRVSVNLQETLSRTVTVDGQVAKPGQYPVPGRVTLMRAIARAGGLTEFAKTEQVVVFRTVGNQDMAALYDLRAIRQGLYADPQIYAEDVVVVGQSEARRMFSYIVQSASLLVTPIIALIQ